MSPRGLVWLPERLSKCLAWCVGWEQWSRISLQRPFGGHSRSV